MSKPLIKAEMHEAVEDYMRDHCGHEEDSHYLHEEIDHPEKRSWLYEQFIEFLTE